MADEPFDERPACALGNSREAGACKRHAVRPGREFFSRSSDHISRVEREFSVLYVNREITGAVVGMHTFGGFKMSGFGAKVGSQAVSFTPYCYGAYLRTRLRADSWGERVNPACPARQTVSQSEREADTYL